MFGKGSKGTGFYHQTTQDAYGILYKRVKNHRNQLEQQNCQSKCCGVVPFLPLCPLIWFTDACGVQTRKRKIAELIDMEAELLARSQAAQPFGPVAGATERGCTGSQAGYYDSGGMWLMPAFVMMAASCGGGGFAAGCGGGGACGGGGCGAAGCGGGGCGGGGSCGGGGCGG